MQRLKRLYKQIVYQLTAKHRYGHGIHSPFVFDLLTNVIEDPSVYYSFFDIETLRNNLYTDNRTITVNDLGAGSVVMKSNKRKIRDIVRYSATTPKYGQLLFRLVNHFEPKTMLELGTSIGIGSAYMAKCNSKSKLYSIEGCSYTAKCAKENFKKLGIKNIDLHIGSFEVKLPEVLKKIDILDFVYFDGNHRSKATISYFNQCLAHVNNNTVFVFDDIHWSDDMEIAWKEIIANKKVTASIDMFFVGIVFFRDEMKKQNFVIKY